MLDQSTVEDTLRRLSAHKGVQGILVATAEGVPIRTTFEPELASQYAGLVSCLSQKARLMVRDLALDDELQFLRVRTKRQEIMIAPGYERDQQYFLVVVQEPQVD